MTSDKEEFHNDPQKHERRPITLNDAEKLMQVRDQILQEHGGAPFESSAELIRQMREEHTRELMGEGYEDEQQQTHPLTPQILAKVLEVHQQIQQSTNGRIFEDSTELIRQMREERSKYLDEL